MAYVKNKLTGEPFRNGIALALKPKGFRVAVQHLLMVLETKMTLDRNAKILMAIFTIALFLNGLNPWLQPPEAGAKENTPISENNINSGCSSPGNGSIGSPEEVKNVERILGYIESAVNDIQLTVKGIDRKMDAVTSFKSADRE